MEQTQTPSDSGHHWPFGIAFAIALVVLIVGLVMAAQQRGIELLSVGIFAVLLVLVTWPIATSIVAWRRSAETERATMAHTLTDRLHQIAALLTTLSEQQLLSDRAKAVAFREKDRQALRSAIREEMNAKDWDAALVLANDMESEFGYAQEAAVLRGEINNNRTEVIRRQISDATTVISEHVQAERWSLALREAERIMQIYPADEQVQRLPQEIEARRQGHKRQLRESLNEAVARNDIDSSIEILKKVDPYLTPAEANAMQDTVRGIFKERLTNLKNQFSDAVHKEKFAEAVRVGELIMQEHPNSRLALEVRDAMETLRQRAGMQPQTV